jgi:hypothetical protein
MAVCEPEGALRLHAGRQRRRAQRAAFDAGVLPVARMMLEDMISGQAPTRRAASSIAHGGPMEAAEVFEAGPDVPGLDHLRPAVRDAPTVTVPFPPELIVARVRCPADRPSQLAVDAARDGPPTAPKSHFPCCHAQ